MRLTITPQDVLRSKTIEPGWHPVEITDVVDSLAKSDNSQNTTVKMVIIGGPFKGVPVDRLFNEKAPGFAINFVEALGGKVSETENVSIELGENLKGRKLQVYIKNELWQGQMKNRVEDFKAL